ncbi:MAG TPA: gliding motility-associated protein GldE [Bacteroidales bacterium]|nr:gliding motility-associated protein GldE [Bacteroidales bacterium]HNS46373.1 gliding motility-associated protein GldE [Bacteroidales bacterium]
MDEPFIAPDLPLGGLLVSTIFQPFSTPTVIILALVILLLLLSALVSTAEIAFFSLTPAQIKALRTSSDYRNQLLSSHLNRPVHLMATLVILRNIIAITIVALFLYLAYRMLDPGVSPGWTLLILILLISMIMLLFTEVIPSTLASRYTMQIARGLAPAMLLTGVVFSPVALLMIRFTSFAERRIAQKKLNDVETEISETIEMVKDASTPEEERKMLKGIVKFGDIEVKEIMRSRMDVTAVDSRTGFRELIAVIINSGYSRIPVYEGTLDSILGILYVKDLLPHIDKDATFEWIHLIRPAFFIPENQRINILLTEFQDKKIHMAVVVDEYGGTAGIITLEDIIEEIVGEISDEYDTESDAPAYTLVDDDTFIFEGKTSLNDFCKIMKIDDTVFDEVKRESDTLAGLVLEILGKLPHKGEMIEWGDFSFIIEAVDNRRIKRIKVHFREHSTQ